VEIVELFASPLHRFEGRPSAGPAPYDGRESVERIEVRAGLGVIGDRYFGHRAHARESVTIQAVESLEAVAEELGVPVPTAAQTRRNVIVRGLPIDGMRDRELVLDSGEGPVRFRVHRPANPCAWMDVAVGPGAFHAFRARGGMRCEPLTDGVLTLGEARFDIL
jgi:MOSC domain-containing protein YiiM